MASHFVIFCWIPERYRDLSSSTEYEGNPFHFIWLALSIDYGKTARRLAGGFDVGLLQCGSVSIQLRKHSLSFCFVLLATRMLTGLLSKYGIRRQYRIILFGARTHGRGLSFCYLLLDTRKIPRSVLEYGIRRQSISFYLACSFLYRLRKNSSQARRWF